MDENNSKDISFDIEELVEPISSDKPCGEDCSNEDDFFKLSDEFTLWAQPKQDR